MLYKQIEQVRFLFNFTSNGKQEGSYDHLEMLHRIENKQDLSSYFNEDGWRLHHDYLVDPNVIFKF
jgi:hypothetical protein